MKGIQFGDHVSVTSSTKFLYRWINDRLFVIFAARNPSGGGGWGGPIGGGGGGPSFSAGHQGGPGFNDFGGNGMPQQVFK